MSSIYKEHFSDAKIQPNSTTNLLNVDKELAFSGDLTTNIKKVEKILDGVKNTNAVKLIKNIER